MGTTNKEKDIVSILGGTSEAVVRCKNCDGALSGKLQTTGDKHCICGYSEPKGWICPVCGAGVSPSTSICPCSTQLRFA